MREWEKQASKLKVLVYLACCAWQPMKVLWNHRFKRCLQWFSAATFANSISVLMKTNINFKSGAAKWQIMLFRWLLGSFQVFEFEPRRVYAAMRVRPQRLDCGNVTEDISLKLKEEASEGGQALSGSKGPSRHLRLDKRTWQISKWSPVYYISVRTPSASLPLCTFISDTDILT